jgi:hypothetical protein
VLGSRVLVSRSLEGPASRRPSQNKKKKKKKKKNRMTSTSASTKTILTSLQTSLM